MIGAPGREDMTWPMQVATTRPRVSPIPVSKHVSRLTGRCRSTSRRVCEALNIAQHCEIPFYARQMMPRKSKKPTPVFESHLGKLYRGDSTAHLASSAFASLRGRVQLILTSPPFPLNNKKSYGNLTGKTYLTWFESLAPIFSHLLKSDGSIVLELGNSWEPKRPVQSLLALEALLSFTKQKDAGLRLIQEFVCYNPSRLPSPASWVTVKRLRTVDSFTHVWWLARSDYPKADNAKVLRPYSEAMRSLLRRKTYNAGKRPSEFNISKDGFLSDRGGSIAHNVFENEPMEPGREVRLPNAFSFANTASNDFFHQMCKKKNVVPHPARMPLGLASFFIEFLTDPKDLVLDPFGGSGTTGFAAASAGRKWLSFETEEKYIQQFKLRFKDPRLQQRKQRT